MMNYIASLLLILITFTASMGFTKEIMLTTANLVYINGGIDQQSMKEAKEKLYELSSARLFIKYPIYIVLDSPGGDIEAGESFIQYAKTIDNVHTITINAASMGAIIVQSLPGKRYVTDNGTFMFHRASLGMRGQIGEGEFESRLNYIKSMVKHINKRVSKRLGLSLEDYNNKIKDEYWVYSTSAVDDKVADEQIDIKCSRALMKTSRTQKMNFGFFAIDVVLSGCPLLN